APPCPSFPLRNKLSVRKRTVRRWRRAFVSWRGVHEAVADMPRRLPQFGYSGTTVPLKDFSLSAAWKCQAPPTGEPTLCSRLTNRGRTTMVLRSSAHNQLTAHREAARESHALMRATIADIEEIIQHSRKVIDDGREAMRRVDNLLQTKKPQLVP